MGNGENCQVVAAAGDDDDDDEDDGTEEFGEDG